MSAALAIFATVAALLVAYAFMDVTVSVYEAARRRVVTRLTRNRRMQ